MSVPSRLVLVDTNVLVYGFDAADLAKQARAIEVLDRPQKASRGCVSVQCLTELYNGLTRKLSPRLEPEEATRHVRSVVESFIVFDLTRNAILAACDLINTNPMSIWDALIWAVASLNDVPVILTEDMAHRPFVSQVQYINPFEPDFDIEAL